MPQPISGHCYRLLVSAWIRNLRDSGLSYFREPVLLQCCTGLLNHVLGNGDFLALIVDQPASGKMRGMTDDVGLGMLALAGV